MAEAQFGYPTDVGPGGQDGRVNFTRLLIVAGVLSLVGVACDTSNHSAVPAQVATTLSPSDEPSGSVAIGPANGTDHSAVTVASSSGTAASATTKPAASSTSPAAEGGPSTGSTATQGSTTLGMSTPTTVAAPVAPSAATTAPAAAKDLCGRWPTLAGSLVKAAATGSGIQVESLVAGPTWAPVHDDANLLAPSTTYHALTVAVGQLGTIGLTSSSTTLRTNVKQVSDQVTATCATIH